MAKQRDETDGALVKVEQPGERAARLVETLSTISPEDLGDLDAVIAHQESQLARLRRVRRLADTLIHGAPKKPGPGKKKAAALAAAAANNGHAAANGHAAPAPAEGDPTREARMLELRRNVVKFLARGPQRSYDIMTKCGVSARWINELLNHPWFAQSGQGVHVTAEGRRAVLDGS